MSIEEFKEKIKSWKGGVVDHEKDLFITLLVLVVAGGAFGLGRLSIIEDSKVPVQIEQVNLDAVSYGQSQAAAVAISTEKNGPVEVQSTIAPKQAGEQVSDTKTADTTTPGKLVASKNGTKYYLPSCGSAKRIKEENKIWFASIEEAKQAGYSPAANCPGL